MRPGSPGGPLSRYVARVAGRLLFAGTEVRSLEVAGYIDVQRARALVGDGLRVRELGGGDAEVGLLALRMRRLAPSGLSWLGLNYGELLFRVGVDLDDGTPAWFAVGCVVDSWLVALFARSLIRYPVRRAARIDIGDSVASAVADGETVLSLTLARRDRMTMHAAPPARPLFVRARGELLQVPWAEVEAPRQWHAGVSIFPGPLELAVLGTHARWTAAVVLEDRGHRCGLASRATARASIP
jgi:hypothetical protein